MGLFRQDEIDGDHPFSIQHFYMCMMTSIINVTKIELSTLTKTDIVDMLMAELRLPRRMVLQLAVIVQKKTSGHAFFVVELLSSLLRDSIIAYNSQKRRFSWDQDTISFIQTGDGVAGLIASNIKSLPPGSQGVLRILTCLGIQTDVSILQMLENHFEQEIIPSLDLLIEQGIIDRAGE